MGPDTVLGTHISVIDGWETAGLRDSGDWRFTLERDAIAELVTHQKATVGTPRPEIHTGHFPKLAPLARECRSRLSAGHGVAWIRAGSPDLLEPTQWNALFSVFGSLMGMAHRIIPTGEPDPTLTPTVGTTTVDGLVPDVVGAVRLSDPADGHEVLLASGTAVHDEMADHEPDLLRALYRVVLHDPDAPADEPRSWHPVYRYDRSSRCLHFRYDRPAIIEAHHRADVPLRDSQVTAMDLLDKSLTLPHLLASIQPAYGDIVLVNNRRIATVGLVRALPPGVLHGARALRVVNPASADVDAVHGDRSSG